MQVIGKIVYSCRVGACDTIYAYMSPDYTNSKGTVMTIIRNSRNSALRFLLVAVVLLAVNAKGAENFRWMLHASAQTNSYVIADVPAEGAYSVHFRAALMDARGGMFKVCIDGVEYECCGCDFMLSGSRESKVVDGQPDNVNYEFRLRNRRYHDFVFISLPGEVHLFGDGDEKGLCKTKPQARREFRIVGEGVDLDVADLECRHNDMRGKWTCRNQIINGGFETLNNDYPIGFSTSNFGFGRAEFVADLEKVRSRYCIDDKIAYEGRNSMRLSCGVPFWECWRRRLSNTDYVYSLYAKAEVPGTKIRLVVAEREKSPLAERLVSVGTEWTRFYLPVKTYKGVGLRCGVSLPSGGTVWIDAMQLERGTEATPFVTRAIIPEELPPDPPKVMDHFYTDVVAPKKSSGRPPRMTKVNPARNSFVVDGKEFFMFGFMGQVGWFGDLESAKKVYDRFKEWDFNFYEWWFVGRQPADADTMAQALGELEKRGVKTLLHLPYDAGAQWVNTQNLALVKAVAHHPNVLGVATFDESYGVVSDETRRRVTDRLRAELGPDVPIQISDRDLGAINHMDMSAADIASFDKYPVGIAEISTLYYVLRQFRDDHPDEVVVYYPLASGHFAMWPRDPTPAEVLAQAYIAYVLEVFNLKWFALSPLTAPVIPAMTQAKRERDLIDPSAFLDGSPWAVACRSRNDAVKFTARVLNGRARIIAINIENRKNEAIWTLPDEPQSVRVLIGRKSDVRRGQGNVVYDGFRPLERRVYEIDLKN